MTQPFFSYLDTPIGDLGIFADQQAINRIEFINKAELLNFKSHTENTVTKLAKEQLQQYFTGSRDNFELPLAPVGTPFRQQTWRALLAIPFGETRYYAQQAQMMDNPKAVRAVGAANGANPIAIVIPCHNIT